MSNEKKPYILFAQIPVDLIQDPKISPYAKTLYGILHSKVPNEEKDLRKGPTICISKKLLAREIGRSVVSVHKYQKELEKNGWLRIKRRGVKRPNQYTLIGKQPIERQRIQRDRDRLERLNARKHRETDDKNT